MSQESESQNSTLPAPNQKPGTPVWSHNRPMNEGRYLSTLTPLQDGTALAAGGIYQTLHEPTIKLKSAEIYDPVHGSWKQVADMNHARSGAQAALLPNGTVLVAAGTDLLESEIYDPQTQAWRLTGALNFSHGLSPTAISLSDGKVMLAGGIAESGDPRLFEAVEIYDPETAEWTRINDMNEGRNLFAMIRMEDGNVLVAGGQGKNFTRTNTAEILDRTTGNWTSIAPMHHRRIGCSAFLLPNGDVMVAGGMSAGGESEAEIYNPATGEWRLIPTLTGNTTTSSVQLKNGKILFVVGAYDPIYTLPVAELFDPVTEQAERITDIPFFPKVPSSPSAALLHDGSVLVAGGYTIPTTNQALVFSPFFMRTPKANSTTGLRPTYSGISLYPNAPVVVIDAVTDKLLDATRTDGQGNWSVTAGQDMKEGMHAVQAGISEKWTITIVFTVANS
ncbi:Kelch repeat-containing protein [Pseudomonas frederiksbergensis]|uniref:Kelch repeat-containing protein n=1 Tax=Pseudomonas TaxID=286 RepID=UPI003D1F6722